MKTELMIREPDLYFDSIHNELNNFLRDTFLHPSFSNPLTIKKNSIWRPAVEIKQNDKEYKVKVQLPGVEIEEEKEQKEEKEINEKYHTCEFRYGKYQRTISFDQPIKASEAKAEYKNGVLCVKIPKQDTETAKGKKLEIN